MLPEKAIKTFELALLASVVHVWLPRAASIKSFITGTPCVSIKSPIICSMVWPVVSRSRTDQLVRHLIIKVRSIDDALSELQ